MFPEDIQTLADAVLDACRDSSVMVAVAESCTGGLIAGALTDRAGSSSVVERGFVTYSNEAKTEMLGVPAELIQAKGAVSAEVAAAMAVGALAKSRAGVAVSVTGIAGPGGATETKPVGRVYIGLAVRGGEVGAEEYTFPGDRQAVRLATVRAALEKLKR
ncbi:CinA family protein [Azospirillum sp. SYSU D00513]|uniref:CinA family protein n=1 Tax=Azospirillum sp. SYSU D00513 TaxID=2812561 RepID=UPI001A95DA8D|nr:CinA family protein [Azospirillum sp. SYSU D00513]